MRTTRTRTAVSAAVTTAALAALLALTATGCSDEDVQKAKDGVASATAKAGEVASSATAKVGEAVASATAAAASKMAEVKDGVDAKGDVKVDGATKADGDRTAAGVTATNSTDKSADYTLTVRFRDSGGNLLDTVVLNIDGVEAGKSKTGTARSNRTLSGATTAEVGQALRH
ncbi:hypothetical protein [Streptomyces sp. NPDC050504]|uniref:hypothetical protein n=1 Tax=Streptomyces sp. NPDC050504 TaxID=3365618 RepID=UPI0037A3B685